MIPYQSVVYPTSVADANHESHSCLLVLEIKMERVRQFTGLAEITPKVFAVSSAPKLIHDTTLISLVNDDITASLENDSSKKDNFVPLCLVAFVCRIALYFCKGLTNFL